MTRIEQRLSALDSTMPKAKQGPELHWDRLTEAETAEYKAIHAKAIALGGPEHLSDADIDRGAFLAEKLQGKTPDQTVKWPGSWE